MKMTMMILCEFVFIIIQYQPMKNLVISMILVMKMLSFQLCPEVQLGEYMYDLRSIK